MTEKHSNKGKVALGVGAGLAALAAAGAGYYFYAAKDAAKNRKKAAAWAKGMKNDVVKAAKKVEQLDKKAIHAIVANIEAAYRKAKNVRPEDVGQLAEELRTHWEKVKAEATKGVKKGTRVAKSSAKRAAVAAKKAAIKAKKPAKKRK